MDEKSDNEDHGRQRRTRRLSIYLILGIVAVVAIGTWAFSSWYTSHYGSRKKLEEPPPPPLLGSKSNGARPQ